jgi:hypothetical protein
LIIIVLHAKICIHSAKFRSQSESHVLSDFLFPAESRIRERYRVSIQSAIDAQFESGNFLQGVCKNLRRRHHKELRGQSRAIIIIHGHGASVRIGQIKHAARAYVYVRT